MAVLIPTFPGNKGPHHSSKTFRPFHTWTIRCLKTSESIYPLTQHHFFDEWDLQLHNYENLTLLKFYHWRLEILIKLQNDKLTKIWTCYFETG